MLIHQKFPNSRESIVQGGRWLTCGEKMLLIPVATGKCGKILTISYLEKDLDYHIQVYIVTNHKSTYFIFLDKHGNYEQSYQ